MNIAEIKSVKLGESYFKISHPTGLTIYVYPKKGYKSSYAIFGTKFGSVYNEFKVDGGEKMRVPDGIAHYLEHKLFENEDGDAFAKYAATGASANAYTSFDKTCYLFSCTEKLEESLKILLDFVQEPYFTEETVEKEQGIIGQEIRMYDDSPGWRVMFNLFESMYHNHPVKTDIAGTVESIAQITPKTLYDCYYSYYNLNNMTLCVTGNVTLEQVLKICDDGLKKNKNQEVETFFPNEPYEVVTDYCEQEFPVTVPLFNMGFKARATEEPLSDKEMACIEILIYLLGGNSFSLYKRLMDEELINSSFSYEHFEGPGYNSVLFSGESKNPKKVAEIIKERVKELQANGIDDEDFQIAKRTIYGGNVASLNNVEYIGNAVVACEFTNRELFCSIDEIANATKDEVENCLRTLLDCDNTSLSVITPKKEG